MPEFKQFYERMAGALKFDKTILCVYRVEVLDRCDEWHRTLQIENNIAEKRLFAYPFFGYARSLFVLCCFLQLLFIMYISQPLQYKDPLSTALPQFLQYTFSLILSLIG